MFFGSYNTLDIIVFIIDSFYSFYSFLMILGGKDIQFI